MPFRIPSSSSESSRPSSVASKSVSTWAFVGGLAVDILTQRPLGSSSFSLLIAVGVGGIVGGFLGRIRIVAPIGATAVASPLYSMLILLTTTALTTVADTRPPPSARSCRRRCTT